MGNQASIYDDLRDAIINRRTFMGYHLIEECISEINNRDMYGNTVLLLALNNGMPMIANKIIYNGADLTITNYENESPLYLACRRNLPDVAMTLLQKAPQMAGVCKYNKLTPLYWAVYYNNVRLIDMLLDYDSHPMLKDNEGMSPYGLFIKHKPAYDPFDYDHLMTKFERYLPMVVKSNCPYCDNVYDNCDCSNLAEQHNMTDFICPVSLDIMRNPVRLSSGMTYDNDSIMMIIRTSGLRRDPLTNTILPNDNITPDNVLQQRIREFISGNKI